MEATMATIILAVTITPGRDRGPAASSEVAREEAGFHLHGWLTRKWICKVLVCMEPCQGSLPEPPPPSPSCHLLLLSVDAFQPPPVVWVGPAEDRSACDTLLSTRRLMHARGTSDTSLRVGVDIWTGAWGM